MPSTTGRKIAVVTGGSGGVGRATVQAFAAAGYDVAALARGQAGLDGAVKDVSAAGGRGLGIATDVADHDAVQRAAEQVESELGEIDVWVNVAFSGSLAYSWDTSDEEFRRMTEVTYYGQVYGTQTALQHMRPRDRGVIVNVGSALAYRSIPLQSAYCGAKHAVVGYTQSVVTELASEKSHVKLCTVQLPGLNTPQFNWNLNKMDGHPMPVAPIFQPELPAKAIVYLAGHPRRNMWVGVPPPTPSWASGPHPDCSTSTSAAPASTPSRAASSCPDGDPTSLTPRTPRPTAAPTGPSTLRRTRATRGCGPRCTARRWPAAHCSPQPRPCSSGCAVPAAGNGQAGSGGPAQLPGVPRRSLPGGQAERPHRGGHRAAAGRRDLLKHPGDGTTPALHHRVHQMLPVAGKAQDQVAPVDRGLAAAQQARRHQAVTGPGRIRRVDAHRQRQRLQVKHAAAGHQHEHPQLRQGDEAFNLDHRLRAHPDQRLGRQHDRIDLFLGDLARCRLMIVCGHEPSIDQQLPSRNRCAYDCSSAINRRYRRTSGRLGNRRALWQCQLTRVEDPHMTAVKDTAVAGPVAQGIDRMVRNIETGRFERALSALTAAGALVTAAEIYFEHDSASFGNKMMWIPVAMGPIGAAAGVAGFFSRRAAKTALPIASAAIVANGLQGTYLHARGIAQKPGGWRNARYNMEMGPPLLAPLLVTLVGGMGLLASVLRREK